MHSFKSYFINELASTKPVETEAMLTLQKVIDMADNGHVEYGPNKIKINVGRLVKNKRYNGLDIFIVKGEGEPKIGRHNSDDKHAIFIFTDKMPKREGIDDFLSDQERSGHFKNLFVKYFNDAVFDGSENNPDSVKEKTANANNRKNFEKSYVDLVQKLNQEYGRYDKARQELEDRIERASDDLGHKEVIKMSLNNLKKDMVGGSMQEFKNKAIELYGKENYKVLDQEYKKKLESRLADYYEHKFQ